MTGLESLSKCSIRVCLVVFSILCHASYRRYKDDKARRAQGAGSVEMLISDDRGEVQDCTTRGLLIRTACQEFFVSSGRRRMLRKHSRGVIVLSYRNPNTITNYICPLPQAPAKAFFAPQETPRPFPSPELSLPDPPPFRSTFSSPLSSSPPQPDPSPLQWLLPVSTTSRRE